MNTKNPHRLSKRQQQPTFGRTIRHTPEKVTKPKVKKTPVKKTSKSARTILVSEKVAIRQKLIDQTDQINRLFHRIEVLEHDSINVYALHKEVATDIEDLATRITEKIGQNSKAKDIDIPTALLRLIGLALATKLSSIEVPR